MELWHLRYFLVVAETENIRAASSIVHVTQPTISRQIQELGIEPFERLPRGLRFNGEGRQYQKHVKEVFRLLDVEDSRGEKGWAATLSAQYIDVD